MIHAKYFSFMFMQGETLNFTDFLEIKFDIFAHISFHDAILRVLTQSRKVPFGTREILYLLCVRSLSALFFHFRKPD